MRQRHPLFLSCCLLLCWAALLQPAVAQDVDYSWPDSTEQSELLSAKALRYKNDSLLSANFHQLQMALEMDSCNVAALKEMCRLLLLLRRGEEAYQMAQRAYVHSDKDEHLGYQLFALAGHMGASEKALEVGEELLKKNPDHPALLEDMSLLYQRAAEPEKAASYLARLKAYKGDHPDIAYAIAKLKAEGKEGWQQAKEEMEAYIRRHPMDKAGYGNYIKLLIEKGKTEEALGIPERMPKELKMEQRPELIRYEIYLSVGDLKAAAKTLLTLSKQEGVQQKEIEALLYQAEKASTAKLPAYVKEFKPVVEELRQRYPEGGFLAYSLAQMYLYEKKKGPALAIFKEMVQKEIDEPMPYLYLAADASERQATEEALGYLREGMKRYEELPDFYTNTAVLQYTQGDSIAALEVVEEGLQKANEKHPSYGQLYLLKGDLLGEQNQLEEALKAYAQALGYLPEDATLLNNYAYALGRAGKELERAERMAAKAVKMRTDEPSFLDTYAWILFLRGRQDLALFYEQKAIEAGGEKTATIWLNYGDILSANDKKIEALQAWAKALALGAQKEKVLQRARKARQELMEKGMSQEEIDAAVLKKKDR